MGHIQPATAATANGRRGSNSGPSWRPAPVTPWRRFRPFAGATIEPVESTSPSGADDKRRPRFEPWSPFLHKESAPRDCFGAAPGFSFASAARSILIRSENGSRLSAMVVRTNAVTAACSSSVRSSTGILLGMASRRRVGNLGCGADERSGRQSDCFGDRLGPGE